MKTAIKWLYIRMCGISYCKGWQKSELKEATWYLLWNHNSCSFSFAMSKDDSYCNIFCFAVHLFWLIISGKVLLRSQVWIVQDATLYILLIKTMENSSARSLCSVKLSSLGDWVGVWLGGWSLSNTLFKPPPPVGAGGGYMFSGRPSVPLSVRPSVRLWLW